MPSIDTLVPDIQRLLADSRAGTGGTLVDVDVLSKLGVDVATAVQNAIAPKPVRERKPNTLYASEIGSPCLRQVWYKVNADKLGLKQEELQPHTLLKFTYGDILEATVLGLAKAAGHDVTMQQHKVSYALRNYAGEEWHINGRMDAVIDGVLVDVKSASTFAFDKFKQGLNDSNDSFGYRSQLNFYNWPQSFQRQGFLVIEKQNGHLGFFEQEYEDPTAVIEKVVHAASQLAAPKRAFNLKPVGKSGNEGLCTECSYCAFKHECWKDANNGDGLRTFLYSTGPVFLGTVAEVPRVPEITKELTAA